jgi:hypothetical protein
MNDLSQCEKWGFHDFKRIIDNSTAIVEVCIKCGKRMVYNKRKGRIDNKKYQEANQRQVLQPWGKTIGEFKKEYGYELDKRGIKK